MKRVAILIDRSSEERIMRALQSKRYSRCAAECVRLWRGVQMAIKAEPLLAIPGVVANMVSLVNEELTIGVGPGLNNDDWNCLVGVLADSEEPPLAIIVNKQAWEHSDDDLRQQIRQAVGRLTGVTSLPPPPPSAPRSLRLV